MPNHRSPDSTKRLRTPVGGYRSANSAIYLLFAALAISMNTHADNDTRPRWPCTFGYVLQTDMLAPNRGAAIRLLAESGRDLLILDARFDGQPQAASRWQPAELEQIRAAHKGRKIVSYLSIGEAEDYREYWQQDWRVDPEGVSNPDFLVAPNPDWPGNYKVRYWDPDWQRIILTELDRLVAQGFDGVYLDIIDAFSYYEHDPETDEWIDDRPNPLSGSTYRRDMVDWVKRIAQHARAQAPGFLVIPQNGAQLLAFDDYLETITAIGVEDLYSLGDEPQSEEHTVYITGYLNLLPAASKPALIVDYATELARRKHSIMSAREKAVPLLLTDRPLSTLGDAFPPPRCIRSQ